MITFIKNWMTERRARADRQRRFVAALERIVKHNGMALVSVMKRQEDLFAFQTFLAKALVTNFGTSENLTIQLIEADPELREAIITLAKQKLSSVESNRKTVLDWIAKMESDTDARACQIEQLETMVAEL